MHGRHCNIWGGERIWEPKKTKEKKYGPLRGCPAQHRAVIYQQIDGGKGEEFVWGGSESIYVGGGGGACTLLFPVSTTQSNVSPYICHPLK